MKFQPDLSVSHYFYAAVLTGGVGSYQKALDHLLQALVLEPRMGAQWVMAALAALLAGQHGAVERFVQGALEIERTPATHYRFVGGWTLKGFSFSHRLDWAAAGRYHQESIDLLRSSDHVYADLFTGLSAFGLGEIALRAKNPEEALTHFRHAWRIVKEKPRLVRNARLGIRTQAGMAACYADLGERDRAEQYVAEASSRIQGLDLSSWSLGLGLAELHYGMASAQLRLGLAEEAVASLGRALNTGFGDAAWFGTDPEWDSLRERKDYRQLAERLRLMPPITIDLSRLPATDPSASNTGTVQRA